MNFSFDISGMNKQFPNTRKAKLATLNATFYFKALRKLENMKKHLSIYFDLFIKSQPLSIKRLNDRFSFFRILLLKIVKRVINLKKQSESFEL